MYIYIERERAGCCGAGFLQTHLFVSYLHSNNFKHLKRYTQHYTTKSRTLLFLSNVFKVRFSLCIVRRQRVRHRGIEWLRIQSSSHNNYHGQETPQIRCILYFINPSLGVGHIGSTRPTRTRISYPGKTLHAIKPIHSNTRTNTSSALACSVRLLENLYVLN